MNWVVFNDALRLFEQAIQIDPALPDSWIGKGMVLGKLGRHEPGMMAFDQALALEPECAAVWYAEGPVFGSVPGSKNGSRV